MQREKAALALAGLASATGRGRDLLLLIKLLLQIGHPRPSSSRSHGDDSTSTPRLTQASSGSCNDQYNASDVLASLTEKSSVRSIPSSKLMR